MCTLRLWIPAIGITLLCYLQLVSQVDINNGTVFYEWERTLKEGTPKEPRAAYSSSVTFVMHNGVFTFLVIEKVQL